MKPRILYVINCLEMGGAEVGVANLVRHGFFEDFELRIVTIWPADPTFIGAHQYLKPFLAEPLCGARRRRAWDLISALAQLLKLVFTWKPSVIIASLPQSVLLGRIASLVRPQTRVITFEHSERLRSQFSTVLFKVTSGLSDGIWADSAATMKSTYHRHGYKKEVARCVIELHDLRSELSLPSPPRSTPFLPLLFVGRLNAVKNLESALLALRTILDDGIPAQLEIYGDGPEWNALQKLCDDLDLRGVVAFHGQDANWSSRPDDHINIGLIVSHREGAALAAQQLLALGYPLIATRVGDIANYMDDSAGWFARSGDPSDIAEAMRNAWASREDWLAMGRRGRDRVGRLHRETKRESWATGREMLGRLCVL